MIVAAIQLLHEEGGSSESSISSYIQANYVGLPSGHDRLLQYYLNTLTAGGLFVVSELGRYSLSSTRQFLCNRRVGGYQHRRGKKQDGGGISANQGHHNPDL